jgi:hypothetical protein
VIDALHRLDAGSGDDRDAAPEFIVEGKDRQRRETSAEPAEDRSNAFGEDHRLHYAIPWAAAQAAARPTSVDLPIPVASRPDTRGGERRSLAFP